jgi:hypothetical protein
MIGPGDMDVGSLRNTMRWKLISEVPLEYLGDMNKNIIRDIIAFVCILLFVTTIGLYLLFKEKVQRSALESQSFDLQGTGQPRSVNRNFQLTQVSRYASTADCAGKASQPISLPLLY